MIIWYYLGLVRDRNTIKEGFTSRLNKRRATTSGNWASIVLFENVSIQNGRVNLFFRGQTSCVHSNWGGHFSSKPMLRSAIDISSPILKLRAMN